MKIARLFIKKEENQRKSLQKIIEREQIDPWWDQVTGAQYLVWSVIVY